ncbi:MAG TPA: sugar ABC transporter permease, partial [Caldilineaceae bacterium]|nr:sugar ABC transporter permease [Caldilineaceae bacterium]
MQSSWPKVLPRRTGMAVNRPGRRLYPWATISLVLLWVALFTLFPFAYAAYLSLHRYHLVQPGHPFVGLRNYARVLGDELFLAALTNTLVFTAASAVGVLLVGLLTALLLNRRLPGFGLLRALVLLPWALPLVSAG